MPTDHFDSTLDRITSGLTNRRTLLLQSLTAGTVATLAPTVWSQQKAPVGSAAPSADNAEEEEDEDDPLVGKQLLLGSFPVINYGSKPEFDDAPDKERLLVIFYWASWCPNCRTQAPLINAWWQKNKAKGVDMLAVSLDENPKAALKYLLANKYEWPSAMMKPSVLKVEPLPPAAANKGANTGASAAVAAVSIERGLPKPSSIPKVILRGRDGVVVAVKSDGVDADDVAELSQFL